MADIKTRDAVKGTIKTIDKAAIATERMKSAYAKTKDKAEQGCYTDESSATEYAADRLSYGADRIKDEGIHQFNKQGQKAVKETRENIGKAKDKISSYKQKKAAKAAEQNNNGLQIRHGAASRSSAPDSTQRAKSQFIKTRQQGKKTVKTTARNAEKTVKATAKGTVKTTQKSVKTAQATSKAAIKTAEHTAKATQAAAKASVKAAQLSAEPNPELAAELKNCWFRYEKNAPDILRGLGFFSSLNNDLFRTVTTRSDDAVTTQTFEYTRQTVAHDAEIATPLIITRTTRSDERESVCRFEIQFRRFDLQN